MRCRTTGGCAHFSYYPTTTTDNCHLSRNLCTFFKLCNEMELSCPAVPLGGQDSKAFKVTLRCTRNIALCSVISSSLQQQRQRRRISFWSSSFLLLLWFVLQGKLHDFLAVASAETGALFLLHVQDV